MEKIKILFADDHGVVRSGLRALFKSSPEFMIVGEASDGEQAIRLAEKCNPDIVLLDITMPRVNGIEATQAIKRNNPNTRVLILTIHEDEDYVYEMNLAGARLAREATPALRSWTESTFLAALSPERPAEEREAIIERYYEAYEALVRENPTEYRGDYVEVYMTIAKTEA